MDESSTASNNNNNGGALGGGGEDDDEGGFNLDLPPNRFRTRSVAIVAGYSPERLYSNMPPGAFVVESGVYKVGGAERGQEWGTDRPEPIYWKQVLLLTLPSPSTHDE